jgi:NitT/TauT family transport system ATP-binding protein
MSGPEPILTVYIERKLYRSHEAGGRIVLEGLRFALAPREIVALVGPSGCGKTTLLKLIGGLDTDFTGRIAWTHVGRPAIGTVFQEPRLLPWRTVRQNIDLVLPSGIDPRSVDALLDLLGLSAAGALYPAQLSLGMARRAAIARAFAIAPEIVLLDEPFVSLDPAMAELSRGVLLTAWRLRPTTALLVTHDLAEAVSLADRILVLAGAPAAIARQIEVPDEIRRTGGEPAARFAREISRAIDRPMPQ